MFLNCVYISNVHQVSTLMEQIFETPVKNIESLKGLLCNSMEQSMYVFIISHFKADL